MKIIKNLFKFLTGQQFALYMDGGGGGSSPVQQQTSISELPDWAKPYAQDTLAKGQALTQKQYQTFDANRIAGFSPLQQQAQKQAEAMTPASQLGTATGMATQAGLQGLGASYAPGYFGNQFRAPEQYAPGQFSMLQAQAPNLQQFQMQGPQDVQGAQAQAAQLAQTPLAQASQFRGPTEIGYDRAAAERVTAPQLQNLQMQAAPDVSTQSFTQPGSAQQYMSPYMQNVVDIQQREAKRQSDIAALGERGQAVQKGAFGGSRQGLIEAERQRNLATQLGDIQATGQQTAFQNAQQQFNTEQQARMQAALANQQTQQQAGVQNLSAALQTQGLGAQTGLTAQQLNQATGLQAGLANQQAGLTAGQFNANMGYNTGLQNAQLAQQANLANQALAGQYGLQQGQFGQAANLQNAQLAQQAALANQQAGLTTGQQNLSALLGVQQLGSGQNLQSQLANQQALQSAQQAAEQSRQYGYGQAMTAAQQRAQYGLAGQQLGEQSRQYGAGLGLQGAGVGLQAANALSNLGQNQYQQAMGINQLQNQYGSQQQALQQQGLSQAYQDFLNQQNYPYKQLGFMSDLIRGMPLGQQSTAQVYQPTTALQTMGGLGLGAYGLKQLGMFADGGMVDGYADGGSVDSPDNVANIVGSLSDAQLEQAAKAAQARGDFEQLQAIQAEKAMRASERGGLAGAYNNLPYPDRARMASGGIVAFAGDDDENDAQTGQLVSAGNPSAYNDALTQALGYNKGLSGFKEQTLSDEDIDNAIKRRYALEQKLAGESPYGSLSKYIEEAEAGRGEAMKQAKGFAALKAMGAIMQPGGFVRGLGAAGGAFGDAMEKANQADRAEKRSLASMQFNLKDAERKERMGMTRSAVSAASEAIKDKRDAERSKLKVLETQANVSAKIAQAAKPVGSAGRAPQPKESATQIGDIAAKIQKDNPGMDPVDVKDQATRQFLSMTKSGTSGAAAKTYTDAMKEYRSFSTLNGSKVKNIIKDQFGGDEAAFKDDFMARVLQGLPTDVYSAKQGAPARSKITARGSTPALPPGAVLDQ